MDYFIDWTEAGGKEWPQSEGFCMRGKRSEQPRYTQMGNMSDIPCLKREGGNTPLKGEKPCSKSLNS